MTPEPAAPAVPRLTYLRIKNYRALRDVEFRDLTPLTVLIGPNGSGKSTVLDALDFLAEAVRGNMVQAWERKGFFREMRTRGVEENIEIEIEAVLDPVGTRVFYKLVVDEVDEIVFVENESLESIGKKRRLFFFDYAEVNPLRQAGFPLDLRLNVYSHDDRKGHSTTMSSNPLITRARFFPDLFSDEGFLALKLANLLNSYRLLHIAGEDAKGYSDAGPKTQLSPNGDNLPNVLYYYHQRHPAVLDRISRKLREWVPGLAEVVPEITSDERLLLRFRDAPFEKPLPAQYMSGGTMRLAALLALLYEPGASGLLGIEEPENELHPQLLPRLAEELVQATEHRQLLVATHSPAILNGMEPEQVWILHRGPDGYTQATRVADLPGIAELVADGSPLGYLWSRNFFDVGNPLAGTDPAGN